MLCWSFVNLSPCWASMNCYMLCICLNCTYVLRSVEEMEKIVSSPITLGRVVRQPSRNIVQMAVAPPRPARQGLTRPAQTSLVSMAGQRRWCDSIAPARLAWLYHATNAGVTLSHQPAIKTREVWAGLVSPCHADMGGMIGLSS